MLRDEARDRVITDMLTFFVYDGSMYTIVYYPHNNATQKWLAEAKRQRLPPE